ncbi:MULTISPECIES: DNA cytosine methyltransferase [unclassified Fibrobacter]|uniref:DNA cytosine methyltransferase n=1 Tax=unclassified Fibrobacter TaxID=2634177 RepID=UPI000D6B1DAB|nr:MULTISPECIES: DNA cytosine methyltransferase [unclassified Fibrobacter]PWJ61242.1 C-5 cytosine-specific DNA methylase [Fibrobacter sp. UWR4]PZW66081.1 C-5 cytosine-specific DNA methylase [Fibrobacter sp. UWR1]
MAKSKNDANAKSIQEFHLFAGIGGGIYGGELLGHQCCAGVEISEFCQTVLKQRQKDGWMNEFEIYGDLRSLNGKDFKGKFDVLCGGFPCQAFSTAAHGKNIAEKNLWDEMFRFVKESDAPVVFGENVVLRAISKAKTDLESVGYKVKFCRLSCSDLGADHQRNRFWLLAVKDDEVFDHIKEHILSLPVFKGKYWNKNPDQLGNEVATTDRREQLKGVGNAQSPFVAASAFRILVNRHIENGNYTEVVSDEEIAKVFEIQKTWIKETFGDEMGLVHTPTTMANYSAPSMMKHQGCRNFKKVFDRPAPKNAEYLMGFPLGASSPEPQGKNNLKKWGA